MRTRAALGLTLATLLGLAAAARAQPGDGQSAGACAGCHAEIAAEWRTSRHAAALSNRLFLASFRREPRAWCLGCHGPLAAQQAPLLGTRPGEELSALEERIAPTLGAEGVSCAACHLRDGLILSARPPSEPGQRAHRMRQDPSLGSSALCGRCHQVNWPRSLAPLEYTGVPMQDTVAELRAAGAPGERCQTCHMRAGSHRFAGGHDLELLRRTLSLRGRREADAVRIELRARGVGHRVPTGDPFRRLRIELYDPDGHEPLLAGATLGRVFVEDHGEMRLLRDTRLPAPPPGSRDAVVELRLPLPLPPERPRRLRLRLSYAYAAPSTESDLEPAEQECVLLEVPVEP